MILINGDKTKKIPMYAVMYHGEIVALYDYKRIYKTRGAAKAALNSMISYADRMYSDRADKASTQAMLKECTVEEVK